MIALWSAQLVALMSVLPTLSLHAAGKTHLREAAVAGSFYPAEPAQLKAMMDQMLEAAPAAQTQGEIFAAIAPHAGYPYSGPVAASTFAALRGRHYKRVVVIAPTHVEAIAFTSVYNGDGYTTPLGTIPLDKEFAHKLASSHGSIKLSAEGHTTSGERGEHAIEVELPWLQHVLGNFTLVPIIMGMQNYESSRELGTALAALIAKEPAGETLILASSDLSHYHSYDEATRLDHRSLAAFTAWDYYSMSRNFESRHWEACGGAPIVAAMIAAERLGANRAELLRYANSGDITGDHGRVVGYSAGLLLRDDQASTTEEPFAMSDDVKQQLLELARKSVEMAVRTHHVYEPEASLAIEREAELGAFVTLHKQGQLRGCIGYTSATKPLTQTIRDTATLAALRDPRFAAVTVEELDSIDYEISVLSPLRHVQNIEEIKIGRDGLLIKRGSREGLLLPQVPVEQHWNRQTLLEQTCHKAGLERDCWKSDQTDIFRFSAVVFRDDKK